MKNYLLFSTLFLFVLISCSDSNNPVSSEDSENEDRTVVVQGNVYGPGSISNKLSSIEDTGSASKNSELQGHIPRFDSEASNRGEFSPDISESFPAVTESTQSNEKPLGGVNVSFYELTDYISDQDNASLLATTTTDTEGQYSVSDLEESTDLVIVAESTPRQTLILMDVDNESTGDINSATSIVSEYWAAEITADRTFDQDNFEEMYQTAGSLIEEMSIEELRNILEALVPDQFGDGFPNDLSSEAQHFVNTLIGIDVTSCEDIEFSAQSARPGILINLQNLPVDLGEDPFAWSSVDGEEEIYPVYLGALEGDTWELLVPMHPINNIDGGNVKIFIESEDALEHCGDFDFEIEPLEPAPGTFESMVDEFENTAISISEMIGYSREELLSKDMNELDSYAAVMKSVLTLIGGPEYPGSLRYSLDNHSSNETLDIYDAVLSELLGSASMGKNIISGDSEVTLFPDFNPCEIPLNGLASGSIFGPTPEDLDCWMNVNKVFEDFNQNEFQTYQDVIRRSTAIIGTVVLPGEAGKELIHGEVDSYLEFMDMMLASFEFLFPSELLGIDLEGDPLIYNNEDDGTRGRWKASIYAQPKDWEFDILLTIGVLPVPGAGKGAGIISKIMRQSEDFQTIVEESYDYMQGEIQSTGIGQYTFEAQVFGPIEIDTQRDEDYFTWELNTKSQETNIDPFSFTQNEQGYTPEAVGTADLRVETKGGDVFKGQRVFNIKELEVEQINVTTGQWIGDNIYTENESPYYINVDEELSLYADVSNAINKDVKWSVSPAESGLSVLEFPERDNVVEVLAAEPGSYTVGAESIADTGPRADNNPRRYDQVRIFVGDLTVNNPGCIEPNNSFQLIARIGRDVVDFSEIEWDITGSGSIDSDGVYTAGGAGDVQIHFQLIDQPQLTHSISFTVKTMCISFTISSPKFNFSGTCVGYEELEGTQRTAIYFDPQFEQPNGQIIIQEIVSEVMSPTETWTVTDPGWKFNSLITSDLEWPSRTWAYAPDENAGAGGNFTLNHEVREYDGADVRVLGGSFSAEFSWEEIVDEEIIERMDPVTIDFTGALPPGEKSSNHACLAGDL